MGAQGVVTVEIVRRDGSKIYFESRAGGISWWIAYEG